MLKAIASHDLHIWHCFMGMPGSHNDINVLDASPHMAEYLAEDAPQFKYTVFHTDVKFGANMYCTIKNEENC